MFCDVKLHAAQDESWEETGENKQDSAQKKASKFVRTYICLALMARVPKLLQSSKTLVEEDIDFFLNY